MLSSIIITAFICIGIGAGAGFIVQRKLYIKQEIEAQSLAEKILDEARKEAVAHKKE